MGRVVGISGDLGEKLESLGGGGGVGGKGTTQSLIL